MTRLCVIEGDGVGSEVIPAALAVLKAALPELEVVPAVAGWQIFREQGTALPPETLAAARDCGAVLFGAVASPSEPTPNYHSPILTLRRELALHANLRPTNSPPGEGRDVDLLIVRENTEGLYAGRERRQGDIAIAERVISRSASERVARTAFQIAEQSGKARVTVIHKSNVMPLTDGLFREVAFEVARAHPQVTCTEMLVDSAAYWLVRDPAQFDVLLTPNLYGDILSDLAAAWGGGLGMAPSLSIGQGAALAEPVHGAAPDIAGQGIANPVGAILSAAMLARWWWGRADDAERIERAVQTLLADGVGTIDVQGARTTVSTAEFGKEVIRSFR